jgi:hypothetical protein
VDYQQRPRTYPYIFKQSNTLTEMNFYQRLNENLSDELIGPAARLKEGEDPMDYVNAGQISCR